MHGRCHYDFDLVQTMTFNAREIATFLADEHACADLIRDAFIEDMTEALEAAHGAGQEAMREAAAKAALGAQLPAHYQWGHDAMEQFHVGKERSAAAIRALPIPQQPASPWRPIEEAPKDGTLVLVYAPEREGLQAICCPCAYRPDAGFCIDEIREPTHFMPLPAAPKAKEPT